MRFRDDSFEPASCPHFFEDFFFGTLPPSFRASDNPIAIACFLLVTFLPDLPLFSVPSLRSCIAFLTFFCAFFPYLAIAHLWFLVLYVVLQTTERGWCRTRHRFRFGDRRGCGAR